MENWSEEERAITEKANSILTENAAKGLKALSVEELESLEERLRNEESRYANIPERKITKEEHIALKAYAKAFDRVWAELESR